MASVRAEHVWKKFRLRKDRPDSVGQLLWQLLPNRRTVTAEPFWALRDVSFEMPPGKSLGIIGHNGAGKSTMLKLLTRTMTPTHGVLDVKGRVSALIELGAGFHPDFTGRENIFLNASILGIRRREIEQRMDAIVDFSGISGFIDAPVKYYSSGMQARLGFSVAIHVEPELLIVDEVLAVGDEAFQRRCMDRIFALKRSGVSILLVAHDLGSVERLMDTVAWLDHGTLRAVGTPHEVVRAYRDSLRPAPEDLPADEGDRAANTPRTLWITGGEVRPLAGGDVVQSGTPAECTVTLQNETALSRRGFLAIVLRRADGLAICEMSSFNDGTPLDIPPGTHRIALLMDEVPLAAGTYQVEAILSDERGLRCDNRDPLCAFTVRAQAPQAGLLHITHRWRVG